VDKKIIYKGAEAEIFLLQYLDKKVVKKHRIKKSYRIKEIDEKLISYRTKEEAKLMNQARASGVSIPIIYDIDLKNGIITMQYIKGDRIKDIFEKISSDKRKELCKEIGKNIARFHNNNIIHGDITTSNMILFKDRVHFIDFGLGEINSEIESKGVDLHVLMEAIESTHSKYSDYFKYVLKGYESEYNKDSKSVFKKIDEIINRGRYR
jgi:TP53 regulating kinase-like protein